MTRWLDVWAEHQTNVGFVEGPRPNENPWTQWLGIGNQPYCDAAVSKVNYDRGVRWWPEGQFSYRGAAYVPYTVQQAKTHGCWGGRDADLKPGDLVVFDWGHDGVADHIETLVALYADGTFDTCGYNTGVPEGCHYPIRRDRKYLLGRVRMEPAFYSPSQPHVGGHVAPGYPFRTTSSQIVDWVELDGHGWLLDSNGATYGSPGSPGVKGVNGQEYFLNRSAAKLHVRSEKGVYVSTIESTSGELYRPDGGPPFQTH